MDPISAHFIAFLVAFVAAAIGTTVGGGGLLSIPILIFIGLPVQAAVATNLLGAFGLGIGGWFAFHRAHKINYRIAFLGSLLAVVGAYLGATTLLSISTDLLEKIVAILIIAILVFVLFNKHIGLEVRSGIGPFKKGVGYFLTGFVGFWGAFFAAGYATFMSFVLMYFFGQTFLQSAGTRKVIGLSVSIIALIIFIREGLIDWSLGGIYFIGMLLGGYVGANYGLQKGNAWVRMLFAVVVIFSAIRLLV